MSHRIIAGGRRVKNEEIHEVSEKINNIPGTFQLVYAAHTPCTVAATDHVCQNDNVENVADANANVSPPTHTYMQFHGYAAPGAAHRQSQACFYD